MAYGATWRSLCPPLLSCVHLLIAVLRNCSIRVISDIKISKKKTETQLQAKPMGQKTRRRRSRINRFNRRLRQHYTQNQSQMKRGSATGRRRGGYYGMAALCLLCIDALNYANLDSSGQYIRSGAAAAAMFPVVLALATLRWQKRYSNKIAQDKNTLTKQQLKFSTISLMLSWQRKYHYYCIIL